MTFVAGDKERKKLKHLSKWFLALFEQPCFTAFFGRVRFVPKPLKYARTETEEKTAPKKKGGKKQKAAAKPKASKPKKPKFEFPATNFKLMDFKTFFVNEKNLDTAMTKFWADFEPQAWSLWHLKYDKYPGECEEVYRTNNLLRGFLSRCQPLGKHVFGVHAIIGDEPSLEIEAVWLIQGLELFPDILQHDQYETYKWTKLDHTKAEDK